MVCSLCCGFAIFLRGSGYSYDDSTFSPNIACGEFVMKIQLVLIYISLHHFTPLVSIEDKFD